MTKFIEVDVVMSLQNGTHPRAVPVNIRTSINTELIARILDVPDAPGQCVLMQPDGALRLNHTRHEVVELCRGN